MVCFVLLLGLVLLFCGCLIVLFCLMIVVLFKLFVVLFVSVVFVTAFWWLFCGCVACACVLLVLCLRLCYSVCCFMFWFDVLLCCCFG